MSLSLPSIHGQKNIVRGFELALRLLAGESFDVRKLQQELNVSRATAYRYWRVLRSHQPSGGAAAIEADAPEPVRWIVRRSGA